MYTFFIRDHRFCDGFRTDSSINHLLLDAFGTTSSGALFNAAEVPKKPSSRTSSSKGTPKGRPSSASVNVRRSKGTFHQQGGR